MFLTIIRRYFYVFDNYPPVLLWLVMTDDTNPYMIMMISADNQTSWYPYICMHACMAPFIDRDRKQPGVSMPAGTGTRSYTYITNINWYNIPVQYICGIVRYEMFIYKSTSNCDRISTHAYIFPYFPVLLVDRNKMLPRSIFGTQIKSIG